MSGDPRCCFAALYWLSETETWVEQDVEVLHTVTISNVKIKKSFCGKGQGAAGAGNAAEA